MQTILDCMTGADGGVAFVNLSTLITEMEYRANGAGDISAAEVLQIVNRFARLIEVANKDTP